MTIVLYLIIEYFPNLSNNNFPLTLENPFHLWHGFFVRISFTCHFRHVFHGWKMNSIITCEKCYSNIYRNTLWIINYFYWVPLLVQLRWLFEVCSAAPFSNMIDFPFAVDFLEKSTKIIYTHTHTHTNMGRVAAFSSFGNKRHSENSCPQFSSMKTKT